MNNCLFTPLPGPRKLNPIKKPEQENHLNEETANKNRYCIQELLKNNHKYYAIAAARKPRTKSEKNIHLKNLLLRCKKSSLSCL